MSGSVANRRNPLSQYAPSGQSLEVAMERYCRLHWSSGRRSCSEPFGALVDSGRSSLTSYGSEESLLSDESEVFSDCYSDQEDEDELADLSLSQFDHLWEEWKIPVKDISFSRNHQIVCTKTKEIRKSGYWHGSVLVYQRSLEKSDVKSFVSEVRTLCKIRHENIQLFMGVCIDMPEKDVGIVMSELKGETLSSHLHRLGRNFTTPSKLKILRQIAEGMEYLHAKGIPHGSLNSKMITIHHRVCISLSLSNRQTRNLDMTDVTYLSYEEVRKVCVGPSHQQLVLSAQPTFNSDVFAYGTIAYELVTLERPYHNAFLVDLVWKLGNGEHQSLVLLPKGRFRSIISRCWSPHSTKRPTFKGILASVQDDAQIPSKYSTHYNHSVPSHLCSLGIN